MLKDNEKEENQSIKWFPEDRIVFLAPSGDFTKDEADKIVNEVSAAFNEITKNEKLNLIIDASKAYKTNHEARRVYTKFAKDYKGKVSKIAMFKANTFTKLIIQFVLSASGTDAKLKIFNNLEDSLKWIREK